MDIELGLEMKANTELKKENRLLKSLLYCTTRSCNNCGKVTCENFQRQRIDCCGNWVSYKDYIKQLEKENVELKETVIKMNNVITETFSNLTKAKKLLQFVSEYEDMTCYADELEEIKQFLNEVKE